jgi:hypothetical protein
MTSQSMRHRTAAQGKSNTTSTTAAAGTGGAASTVDAANITYFYYLFLYFCVHKSRDISRTKHTGLLRLYVSDEVD